MNVRMTLAPGLMMMALIGSTARADSILTLGVFDGSNSNTTTSNSVGMFSMGMATSPSTSFQTAPAPAPTTGLNLAGNDSTNQVVANAPAAPSYPQSPAPAPTPTYDAFINLGAGPYANSADLTTGNPLPWYDSPAVAKLFGGIPNAQQQASFDATVLQRAQQGFALSGVPVSLTDNPNASAAHSLSVVSNAVNPTLNTAIGMTYLGGNGFHFIDNSAPSAQNVDQLEWIVAHNIDHELMLAFGVPEDHDTTGQYIDSRSGSLSMFLNPNATFSPGAVEDLLSQDFLASNSPTPSPGAQLIDGQNVPEPTTLAIWGLAAVGALLFGRARSGRKAD